MVGYQHPEQQLFRLPTPLSRRKRLPMDWTRMKRKRCDDDECCDDPVNCQLRSRRTSSSALPLKKTISNKKERIHDGHAIFCLHDTTNPSWFQGYFLPPNTANPWGLLAVQEEIDKCLECGSGGYRRLTLKLPNHHPRIINNNIQQQVLLESQALIGPVATSCKI
jgi:hypothetical protein